MVSAASFIEFLNFKQYLLGRFPESMVQLGMLLRGGKPLAEALFHLSQTSVNSRVKSAAVAAARRLSSGEGCEKVFAGNAMAVFPAPIRYILATPLSDVTKGRLIADWKFRHKNEFRFEAALTYPLQSLIVGLLTILSLFMFVFPQMREIFYGLRVKTSPLVAWVFELCGDGSFVWGILVILAFAVLLSLVVFFARQMTRFPQKIDEMNLLRMLAVLPPEDRVRTFDLMAVKHNFPALHVRFKKLARALNDGVDAGSACRDAGLEDLLAWFLTLGLLEEGSEPKLLLHAADYLNTRVESSVTKTVSLLEVASVLFQAALFGTMAYALVQMMLAITLGIFE